MPVIIDALDTEIEKTGAQLRSISALQALIRKLDILLVRVALRSSSRRRDKSCPTASAHQKLFISAKMLAASFRESLLSTDSEESLGHLLGALDHWLLGLGDGGALLGAVELDVAV